MGQNGGGGGAYQWCGLWGYRNDWDAGLMHVGARYYEVETGRWVQKDPWLGAIRSPQTLNRYIYAINSPAEFIDIVGRKITAVKITSVIGIDDIIAPISMIKDIVEESKPGASSDPWYEDVWEAISGTAAAISGVGLIAVAATTTVPATAITGAIVGSMLLATGISKLVVQIADIFTDW